jgi:hypothetical protein
MTIAVSSEIESSYIFLTKILLEKYSCMKYHSKPHLIINVHIKNEGQEGKAGPVWGWVPVGWGKLNGEG